MTTVSRRPSSSVIPAFTAIVALLAGVGMAAADGRSSTVTLDFEHGTISPGDPTINLNAHPSVVLEIVPPGNYEIIPTRSLESGRTKPAADRSSTVSAGAESKERTITGDRAVFNFVPDREDRIDGQPGGAWSWTIYMKKGMRDYPIEVKCVPVRPDPAKQDSTVPAECKRAHMVAVIHIETATYDLAWSAGLAVNSLRDARYRIDPNPDDPNHSALVRNGRGGYPYELATAANFCLVRHDWLCPITVGVSTAIPVDKLTILLGPAVRFRPLDISNSLYLSVGVAYGSRKELNDDYAGRSTVPAGTTSASVLTDRRGFGGYVGLTFGFLGGADKFKGVFSGSGEKTAQATPK